MNKRKISIRISPKRLEKIQQDIDAGAFTNRTHAIESGLDGNDLRKKGFAEALKLKVQLADAMSTIHSQQRTIENLTE